MTTTAASVSTCTASASYALSIRITYRCRGERDLEPELSHPARRLVPHVSLTPSIKSWLCRSNSTRPTLCQLSERDYLQSNDDACLLQLCLGSSRSRLIQSWRALTWSRPAGARRFPRPRTAGGEKSGERQYRVAKCASKKRFRSRMGVRRRMK